jgi:N-acetylglucosamine-6-phosphate deacetylase
MRTVITAARLWDGAAFTDNPVIAIEDGRIASLAAQSEKEVGDGLRLNFPSATLSPSFLDVHIHGAAGHDVMEATPAALDTMGRFLAAHGTGSFLATTVTAPIDTTLRSLSGLAKLIESSATSTTPAAKPIGLHLEGPFLSHAKRGVHPPDLLLAPDIAVFDRMFEAAEGHLRLITLAPELPGATELAAHATARGVRVSVGHSNATAAETRAVIAAGAVSATHTFNAMRPLDHREPGILGVTLTTDDLYAELICDGIHVDAALVQLWWRAKGPDRAILVTDAMSAAGMPDGEYSLGGFPVQVANGKATANGVLARSVLTLDRALQNFIAFTGASVDAALPLVSSNPAAMTGLESSAIAAGSPATFVALNEQGALLAAFVHGQLHGQPQS